MHYCLIRVFPSEYDYRKQEKEEHKEMEEQENTDYTVFLNVEKQVLMDLGLVKDKKYFPHQKLRAHYHL